MGIAIPNYPEVFAAGDSAAVPDLTRAGLTTMTAQHAERQGNLAAHNVAASLDDGAYRPYKHHELGFVVDLAGLSAAANPLGFSLSGLPAKTLTRAYHLINAPTNKARIAANWLLDAVSGRQLQQLGLVGADEVPLGTERE